MHRLSRNMKAGLGCCFQANQAISCSSFFWIAVIIPRRAFSFTGPTANSQPNLMAIYQMPPKVCEPCLLPAVLPACTAERATGPPQPNGCFQSSCSLHHYSLGYFGIFLPQARHRKFGDFGKRPQKKKVIILWLIHILQLCIFPLRKSNSPRTTESTGTCITWAQLSCSLPELIRLLLSLFLSTAFLHSLFAQGTCCASRLNRQWKELTAFLQQRDLGQNCGLGTTKSLLVLPRPACAGLSQPWPLLSAPSVQCTKSRCFWSPDVRGWHRALLLLLPEAQGQAEDPKAWQEADIKQLPRDMTGEKANLAS